MRLGKSNLSAVEKITIVLMNLLHLPISALNAFAIDKPLEYAKLYLDGTMQIWVDAEGASQSLCKPPN